MLGPDSAGSSRVQELIPDSPSEPWDAWEAPHPDASLPKLPFTPADPAELQDQADPCAKFAHNCSSARLHKICTAHAPLTSAPAASVTLSQKVHRRLRRRSVLSSWSRLVAIKNRVMGVLGHQLQTC